MNFKEEVMFMLNNMNKINEACEDKECKASCKTKKENKCPVCGKAKCECTCDTEEEKASCKSVSTKTAGADDDNDGYEAYASVKGEPPADFGDTPEEREMMKLVKGKKSKKGEPAEDFGDTPEEREMMKLVKGKKSKKGEPAEDFGDTPEEREMMKLVKGKKSVVADDHTNGRCGSVRTMKEEMMSFADSKALTEEANTKAKEVADSITSKLFSKALLKESKAGNKEASNAYRLVSKVEDEYIHNVPGAKIKYDKLVEEYIHLI